MTEVRIRASRAMAFPAVEPPRPLRDELRALCQRAPRRLNRFTELALIGALGCAQQADMPLPSDCALYLATGQGFADDTARLLEALLIEQQAPMPVDFINVSGSSAGFYLAQTLGLDSRNNTIAAGPASFEAALSLAWGALADHPGLALVGGVDVAGHPLADHRQRLGLAPDTGIVEISSWLLLDSRANATGASLVRPQYWGNFAEALEDLRARKPGPWSLGNGLTTSERSQLRALADEVLPAPDSGQADTLSAYAIASWLEKKPSTGPLLHLNGDGAGGYYLVELLP